MDHAITPIPVRPWTLNGLSERLIVSHYENHYGTAVRTLNAIRRELAAFDARTPGYRIRALKREELSAMGSVVLHELTDRQSLDAVAVAMLTPGPVVITMAFIGYLVAQFPGAVAAAIGVFLPVYLFVVIPFRLFDRISENAQVKAFDTEVTAAASGVIAGAGVVLARRAVVDVPTLCIVGLALGLSWRFKVPEPVLIAGGAAAGLLITWHAVRTEGTS